MDSQRPAVSFPSELWLHIFRLATSDTSPMVAAYTEFQYAPVADPLKDMSDACSFALVCRLWNSLANEILYENIRVDNHFYTLHAALAKPGTAHLVRSVQLSTTRV
ncbi:hypothetical protein B0H19DRAFT_1133230 [Mycena capillaripes]|nr:hypothetical protein B0H19DRAFT_1133230 [Mycena capillaripes]